MWPHNTSQVRSQAKRTDTPIFLQGEYHNWSTTHLCPTDEDGSLLYNEITAVGAAAKL